MNRIRGLSHPEGPAGLTICSLAVLVCLAGLQPRAARAEGPAPSFTAGFLPSTHKVVPTVDPDVAAPERLREIEGLRDEWVSFQILLRTDGPITGINMAAADFEDDDGHVIPASAFTFYREWFLNVTETSGGGWAVPNHLREPGLYPDPLIPFVDPYADGAVPVAAPFDLLDDTGSIAVVWVDLHIPADAPPGLYFGGVVVTADGQPERGIQLSVQVWELDMPRERNIGTAYGLCEGCVRSYHGGPDGGATEPGYDEIVRNYYKVLHENRIDVTTTTSSVNFQFDGDGKLLPMDWTAYDAFMQPRIDGSYFDDEGAGIARFNCGMFSPGGGTGSWTEDQYKQAAKAYVEHLDDKGWLDRMWTYSTDEPWLNGGEETWNRVIHDATLLHEASPLWEGHVLVTGPMYAGAEEVVDIWCPVNPMYDKWFWFDMDYAGRGDYDEHIANNGELWFYNCNGNFPPYPGYDIDTTIGYEPRILKWGSWFEKATGFLHWGLNIWYYVEPWKYWQSRDVFGELFARNGDGMLIYPGDSNGYHVDGEGNPIPTGAPAWMHIDGPIMSYRVKQIRDGLEDWELFNMAEKAGIGDWVRNEMGRAYTRFGDFFVEDCAQDYYYCPDKGEPWTLDQYVMLDVRRRVIAKLLFTMHPDRYPDPDEVVIPEVVEEPVVEDGPDAILADAGADDGSASDTVVQDSRADAPDAAAPADTIATDTSATDGEGHEERGGCSAGNGSRSGTMPLVAVFSIFLLAVGVFRARRAVADSRNGQIE